jgi:hypothetical protein
MKRTLMKFVIATFYDWIKKVNVYFPKKFYEMFFSTAPFMKMPLDIFV